jgi:hypothetical protein
VGGEDLTPLTSKSTTIQTSAIAGGMITNVKIVCPNSGTRNKPSLVNEDARDSREPLGW